MKPNCKIFIQYMAKYSNKGMCLRMIYKDYDVQKEDRPAFVKAYDFLKEKGDAIQVGEATQVPVDARASDSEALDGEIRESTEGQEKEIES